MRYKIVKLGEICDFEGGSQPQKSNFIFEPKKGYIRFIQIRDFKSDKNFTYIPIAKKNRICKAEDVLIGRYGASVGKILTGLSGAYNVALMKTKPNQKNLDKKFLYYYLISNLFQELLKKVSARSAQNGFSKDDIYNFPFTLPLLSEQQRIVAKLDAAFTEIDKTISMVLKSIENVDLLFEKKIKQHFVDNIINAPFVKLSDISEYFNGLTYSPKDVSENGTIVLRSGNIQNGKMKYSDIKRVNKKIKDKLYVKATDILICSRNGSQKLIGKSSLIGEINEPMTFGTFMMIIRSEYNEYLQWFVKSKLFKRQIVKGENTMINQITRYMLDDISLPFPDAKSYKKISKELKELDGHRRRLNEIFNTKIENFKKLKSAILKQELLEKAA